VDTFEITRGFISSGCTTRVPDVPFPGTTLAKRPVSAVGIYWKISVLPNKPRDGALRCLEPFIAPWTCFDLPRRRCIQNSRHGDARPRADAATPVRILFPNEPAASGVHDVKSALFNQLLARLVFEEYFQIKIEHVPIMKIFVR